MKQLHQRWMVMLILLCVICVLGGCSKQEPVDLDFRFDESIHRLEMDVGAANIRFRAGEAFHVWTDNPYICAELRNGILILREKPHIADLESSEVVVAFPDEIILEEADLEIGAGMLTIDTLHCRNLDLDLGAGQTTIHNLQVDTKAEIAGGAGQILIYSGEIRNLELELGIGESVIHALILGKSSIEAGVGSLELTIPGSQEEYTIQNRAGIGSVSVNGTVLGKQPVGSGQNHIEIHGGVGNVTIAFSG